MILQVDYFHLAIIVILVLVSLVELIFDILIWVMTIVVNLSPLSICIICPLHHFKFYSWVCHYLITTNMKNFSYAHQYDEHDYVLLTFYGKDYIHYLIY